MRVNSHNEWDPLNEVIVGLGVPESLPAIDFTFKLFFHDNIQGKRIGEPGQEYITKKLIEEHNKDIENFAILLKSHGVTVKRPRSFDRIRNTKTLTWESSSHPSLNCRDMCIVIGNMIIESPPTCRWRYFENDHLKHLFLDYFKHGAKWVSAPKPLMTDNSFDLSYLKEFESNTQQNLFDCGFEIMFDAANCMRLGSHILMNVSNENQKLGAQWLRDVIPNDYTIWECSICDNHIDSEFIPLRPGLALITTLTIKDKLPKELQCWDLILVPEIHKKMEEYKLCANPVLASPKIDYNILSLSPDVIICSPECERVLSHKLKKYNIESIPCDIRHGDIFAGAHHCVTLDINRTGELENYF